MARCDNDACGHIHIAYNSCRNRHCPKCQATAAREWLEAREAELLPVEYFHVVFTLPAAVADLAVQNKRVMYDLLFKASAETMLTIAADPDHLGAKIGITAVLHTWGSAMTHHPHVHMSCWKHVFDMTPGGGISSDGTQWISCRPDFFLPVRVLSRLFRRLFLEMLAKAHSAGRLSFHGHQAVLADRTTFDAILKHSGKSERVVYAKQPFTGPEAVLACLSRYTHRVAISNRRLVSADKNHVAFRYKDYRADHRNRWKTMTLTPHDFIRRFMLHVLSKGFHRIPHYGLFANGNRIANIVQIRQLLSVPAPAKTDTDGPVRRTTDLRPALPLVRRTHDRH